MVDVRLLMVLVVASALAMPATAHTMSEQGNILGPGVPESMQPTVIGINGILPGVIPNGVLYYEVNGVQGGDSFTVVADDGQEAFVVGLADECPGPEWSPEGLLAGDDSPEEVWLACQNVPEVTIWFRCNGEPTRPSGTVPCDGSAFIFIWLGDSGEGFTYSES